MMIRYSGFEHLLRDQSERQPEAPALAFSEQDGKIETLTYLQLYKQVTVRCEELRREKGRCLGILCDTSPACILTILAAPLSGKQTVLLDANAPDELLQDQIRYTDIDCLWGDEELIEELTDETPLPSPGRFSETGSCGSSGCSGKTAAQGAADRLAGPAPGNILFFTSGTTDACKAVVLTDRSLMSSAWNGSSMLPLGQEDTLLCCLPLNHVFGFVCSLLWGLQCGACAALGRGMRYILSDFSLFKPTVVSLVPALLGFLLKQNALSPSLKTILIGAGDCPASLLDAVNAMGIRVSFGYGLTETSSGVAISTSGDPYALSLCPDVSIDLAPDGEILLRADPCIMQGYYKLPEETSEVLHDGLLSTGDLGRFDENGKLHIIGRKKEILVLPDGTKIFLPEYEERIRHALGDTDMAVLQKEQGPVLVIHDKSGTLTRKDVLGRIAPVMAEYPRGQQIKEILFLDSPLPRTATGKVQRHLIK